MAGTMIRSWKTTVFGALAALPSILTGLGINLTGKAATVASLITGIGTLLFGLFAKDNNVTGGTVQQ